MWSHYYLGGGAGRGVISSLFRGWGREGYGFRHYLGGGAGRVWISREVEYFAI